jgi:ketosteroid isomerase-like protein
MMRFRSLLLTSAATCAALLGACSREPAAPPDHRAADEAAVEKADADWSAAAQAHNVDSWVAFYGDDAVVLPPNEAMATNKDAIQKSISELLQLPAVSVSWTTAKAEASRSGDLAYTYGTYQLSWNDEKGEPANDHGKYTEVWRKQPDGSWKCILDMWSSDVPVAPAPAPKTKHRAAKHAHRRRHHANQ